MRQHTRNAVGFVVLAILMAALFYWNINTGSVHLSLEPHAPPSSAGATTAPRRAISSGKSAWSRLLGAALLGGALSIAGFLLQTFFKNPIAGPFVLGISSGSRLFVGFFLLAATPIGDGGFSPYVIFLGGLRRGTGGHGSGAGRVQPGAEPSHAAGHRHDDRLHLRRGHRLHDHLRRE